MKKLVLFLFATNISVVMAQNNPIFFGGNGDGVSNISFAQSVNNIFSGGNGDGWDNTSFAQLGNNIFMGGNGDGWAANLIPLTPLPITLVYFTGEQINSQNILKWQASQEINSDYFIMERSANSVSFIPIGNTPAKSLGTLNANYSFIDATPFIGNNFYRLKMVDKDGKFEYSNIVLLKSNLDKSSILIYPNPTATQLNIKFNGIADNSKVIIKMFDVAGKLIELNQIQKNDLQFNINVANYPAGIFTLQIIEESQVTNLKFIKR